MDIPESWQFIVIVVAFIGLGFQIIRANRDMFLKLATKEDIGRVENRLENLESRLNNIESRVDILETRLIEYEGKRVENQNQAVELIKTMHERINALVDVGEKLKANT